MNDSLAFAPGQVWTYHGAGLPSARVVVGRVDPADGEAGPIVSVSVIDVLLPDRETGEVSARSIDHAPITGAALARSVRDCVGQVAVPEDFAAGYGLWRKAYDEGRAGAFTISVAELEHFFRTMLTPATDRPH